MPSTLSAPRRCFGGAMALAAASVICTASCGSANDASGVDDAAIDGATDARVTLADAGSGAEATDSSASDASLCSAQIEELEANLDNGSCSRCIGSKCTFFIEPCKMDCTCVDSAIIVLACLMVAGGRGNCLQNVATDFTPAEINDYALCAATCESACDNAAKDSGAPSGDDDASDAGDFDAAD